MFLQVVADPRDVGVDLVAVGEPHARNLAQRRIRLLGRRGLDLRAHAAFLRRALQRRRTHLVALLDARRAYQLIYGRHFVSWDRIFTRSLARRPASLNRPRLFESVLEKTRLEAPLRAGFLSRPRRETTLSKKPPKGEFALGVNTFI